MLANHSNENAHAEALEMIPAVLGAPTDDLARLVSLCASGNGATAAMLTEALERMRPMYALPCRSLGLTRDELDQSMVYSLGMGRIDERALADDQRKFVATYAVLAMAVKAITAAWTVRSASDVGDKSHRIVIDQMKLFRALCEVCDDATESVAAEQFDNGWKPDPREIGPLLGITA